MPPGRKPSGPSAIGLMNAVTLAKPSTAMAVKMPRLSPKWCAGAACDTPARRAISRMLSRAAPTASTSATAAAITAARRSPWWYGFVAHPSA